ncbi:hypothetical protein RYX36_007859 [Vicia faba]
MEDTQEIDKVQEVISDKTSEKEEETRDELKVARLSKKLRKKQVEEEVSQISTKLKEKHAKELSTLGYSSGKGNEKRNLDNLVKAIAGVTVSSQPENTKVNKAK